MKLGYVIYWKIYLYSLESSWVSYSVVSKETSWGTVQTSQSEDVKEDVL